MVNCRCLVQCQQHLHSLSLGENLSKLHYFFLFSHVFRNNFMKQINWSWWSVISVVIHSVHHICTQINYEFSHLLEAFWGKWNMLRILQMFRGKLVGLLWAWPWDELTRDKWEQTQLVVKVRQTECQLIANKCKYCTLTTCSPGLQV